MLKEQRTLQHEGINKEYAESELVLFGIPFDGTVSNRPGTRFGPRGIRRELDGLETYSPYLNRDLDDYLICDLGDIELNFGNTKETLHRIQKETAEIVSDGKKTLALGGEHLVSYPLIELFQKKYPSLVVIHLDAHADLRDDYLGESLSHATVMRRALSCLEPGSLYQFGIRSGTREEFSFAKENTHFYPYCLNEMPEVLKTLGDLPLYVSLDLDVLDPSAFPGTGTPEPGGVSFKELLRAIHALVGCNVVGADVVELSPQYDVSGVSDATAAKVVRELALAML
ncbi:agmatinase [Clostridia bacterium]|nr:agmatinase [Clostridia bacterium]